MLGYLGSFLALLGGIIGLAGDTWNRKRRGIRKLTRNGWLALLIIVAGFLLSALSSYHEAKRAAKIHTVASEEIEEAWRALVYPFTIMLWQVEGHDAGYESSEIRRLLDDQVLFSSVMSINLRGDTPHYQGPWPKILGESSRNGKLALDTARSTFAAILDEDLVVAIQRVVSAYYLDFLMVADSLDALKLPHVTDATPYPLRNLAEPAQAEKYLRALLALHIELEHHLPRNDHEASN